MNHYRTQLPPDANSIAGTSIDEPVIEFNLEAEPLSDHQGFDSLDDHQVLFSLSLSNNKTISNNIITQSEASGYSTRQSTSITVTQSPPIPISHSLPPATPPNTLPSQPLDSAGHEGDTSTSTTNTSNLHGGTSSLAIEHALVPVDSLLVVVNENLGKYKICKEHTLRMIKLTTMHLAQGFGLECTNCLQKYGALTSRLRRLNKK